MVGIVQQFVKDQISADERDVRLAQLAAHFQVFWAAL
jgi:hypothetical protein